MRKVVILSVLLTLFSTAWSKEGMWIPTLLKKYNIEEMQKMGFKLTAEDIYDVNHASMKDAVVLFGGGCTGELISDDGLLITNHHCGYGQIQKHSSVEHDYLTNGFWAMNKSEELSNPGLSVQFLLKMEDVTGRVFENTEGITNTEEKSAKVAENIKNIVADYANGPNYPAEVKPLFYGNQYFVYVYEVFRDVRLVGAPPSAIGKFGGDTDNWMWPRHTGDFSIFRIYAGKDNKPAEFSSDNVPYKPKKFFKINMKGIEEGDFTMVFGFPGSTQRYLPSAAVKLIMEQSDPNRVAVRTMKLDILAEQMNADAKTRIQYSSKYANISNAWKKWQGEIKGLHRLDAVETKKKEEARFQEWAGATPERKVRYGNILSQFDQLYTEIAPWQLVNDYFSESIQRGTDVAQLVQLFSGLKKSVGDTARFNRTKAALPKYIASWLKDYDPKTDGKVFGALTRLYFDKVSPDYVSPGYRKLQSDVTAQQLIADFYHKSILTDSLRLKKFASEFSGKSLSALEKDPLFSLLESLNEHYFNNVSPVLNDIQQSVNSLQKEYMKGLMEMHEGEPLIADANLTLRVSYGKVEGYQPADGVTYQYFTTLNGIIEKDNPSIYDYDVPDALRQLYDKRDFGPYTNRTGEVPVAFCASNHTTGGNSGSPVLNANGELIGVNFDRCWEGTMSDIMFDPEMCRNIALDIRFALFVIDKFAGAGYLLDEMEIVK